MNILIVGINGRMGQMLKEVAIKNNHKIIAGIDIKKDVKNNIFNNFKLPKNILEKIDIVIDFALPSVLNEEIDFCVKNNKKLIICSTGHTKEQIETIEKASKIIPIFKTTNTSVGIALILKILHENINILKDYQIELVEKHHAQKKDSPSGTAKSILNELDKAQKNIPCHSMRAGSVTGEHEILLFANGEQISIKHIAESRELFATGAIKIAEFMKKIKAPRLYNMFDLLAK